MNNNRLVNQQTAIDVLNTYNCVIKYSKKNKIIMYIRYFTILSISQ